MVYLVILFGKSMQEWVAGGVEEREERGHCNNGE
jgi:hypothetical protein